MNIDKTAAAHSRAMKFVDADINVAKFNGMQESKDWFVLQTVGLSAQLLEGMPRIKKTYDLTRLAQAFDFLVQDAEWLGAKPILDELVETTESAMNFFEEARPEGYEKYSKIFLRDIFKIVYGLEE